MATCKKIKELSRDKYCSVCSNPKSKKKCKRNVEVLDECIPHSPIITCLAVGNLSPDEYCKPCRNPHWKQRCIRSSSFDLNSGTQNIPAKRMRTNVQLLEMEDFHENKRQLPQIKSQRGMDKIFDRDVETLAVYQVKLLRDVIEKLTKEKRNATNALRKSEKQKRQMTIQSFKSHQPSKKLDIIPSGKGFSSDRTLRSLIFFFHILVSFIIVDN